MIHLKLNDHSYKIDHLTTNLMEKRTGRIVGKHRHPVFHLMYISEGRGLFEINNTATEAEEGMLFIISPNEWHEFYGNENEPLSDFECTFRLMDTNGNPVETNFFDIVEHHRGIRLLPLLRERPLRVPSHLQSLVIEGFQRILESRHVFFTKEHLGVMIVDLMLRIEEILIRVCGFEHAVLNKSGETIVTMIKKYLRMNMGRPVTLNELASFVHITPNYLCKIFKELSGETPMSYLHHIRMLEAEKLLVHTDLPVYMIAEKLGFEEASYFARVFRKKHGTSPTEYRQQFYTSVNMIK